VTFTQPLCPACFAAWSLGKFGEIREPTRVRVNSVATEDSCCICHGPNDGIYTRIDPTKVPNPRSEGG
jgi:hypothetical protein